MDPLELIETINKIDISNIEGVRFFQNDGKTYSISHESIKKIALYIQGKYSKTVFSAGELNCEKDFLVEYYKSSLSPDNYKLIVGTLSQWVGGGGRFEIIYLPQEERKNSEVKNNLQRTPGTIGLREKLLGGTAVLFLFISIFLYILLGQTKTKMLDEILVVQDNLKSLKASSEAEILSLKKEIEKLKNPTLPDGGKQSDVSTILRDKERISHLRDIMMALGAYYADNEKYPDTSEDGCVPAPELNRNYLPRGIPTDPLNINPNKGCLSGQYVYRGGFSNKEGVPGFAIGTTLENSSLGNSRKPLEDYTNEELSDIDNILKISSGRYYIVIN